MLNKFRMLVNPVVVAGLRDERIDSPGNLLYYHRKLLLLRTFTSRTSQSQKRLNHGRRPHTVFLDQGNHGAVIYADAVGSVHSTCIHLCVPHSGTRGYMFCPFENNQISRLLADRK
ncbi:MAG: hypothetical protein A2072_01170 [Nitrospirae bacterium GWC1_57_7]|jgi:hypothetical protein|nr:MAG: hypothetical protein A2072_01170 [Nitrospirae bacterium GWC1_57_7]OGW45826.1 MAG: hypothetical protein A2X57_06725 [Nitrospirae bacterium GWD2_57_8]